MTSVMLFEQLFAVEVGILFFSFYCVNGLVRNIIFGAYSVRQTGPPSSLSIYLRICLRRQL